MSSLIFLSFVLITFKITTAKIVPAIYEEMELCVPPEQRAPNFDLSELEIIAESDTKVYLNGSWNFVEEVKSPWNMKIYAEKYERGVWNVQAYNRKIPDFCKVIQSPLEPWYFITSKYNPKNCPFPKGTKILFNMQGISELPTVLPRSFVGKWRLTISSVFDEASEKSHCLRTYADLIEE